jgi:hypothetical protein
MRSGFPFIQVGRFSLRPLQSTITRAREYMLPLRRLVQTAGVLENAGKANGIAVPAWDSRHSVGLPRSELPEQS